MFTKHLPIIIKKKNIQNAEYTAFVNFTKYDFSVSVWIVLRSNRVVEQQLEEVKCSSRE